MHSAALHPAHLVGSELLALPTATNDDAKLVIAVAHRPSDGRTEGRVVDRLGGIGAEVVDDVSGAAQPGGEVLLEIEPGMIGSDRDRGHRSAMLRA